MDYPKIIKLVITSDVNASLYIVIYARMVGKLDPTSTTHFCEVLLIYALKNKGQKGSAHRLEDYIPRLATVKRI